MTNERRTMYDDVCIAKRYYDNVSFPHMYTPLLSNEDILYPAFTRKITTLMARAVECFV